ncbi:radical SAM protein [Methanomicrobiaceae archaeon CYW5]|nr:radical SAM protein [Methanovulcanius yangii]
MVATASYVPLYHEGELQKRADSARKILTDCRLCPRECGVNRLDGEHGFCRAGSSAEISGYGPHFGEEPPLVGRNGSGTVFFSHCTMGCIFCQNYRTSQLGEGRPVSAQELGRIFLRLQEAGCHNVNLVSPTHYIPQILEALLFAVSGGLDIPLVYNTGGYDSVAAIRLLEGVVDIYMPDAKFGDEQIARRLTGAIDYPVHMMAAVREMHRQVGDLACDREGIAVKGLLVRHLILPEGLATSEPVFRFLADEISPETYVNIMDQYRPEWKACTADEFTCLCRRITGEEYDDAVQAARAAGLHRGGMEPEQ